MLRASLRGLLSRKLRLTLAVVAIMLGTGFLSGAFVMTDTFGRPWRDGHTNIAIGVAGLRPMRSYVGMPDMDGRELRVTTICVADQLAGAAELVMGKLDAVPAAIVRGFPYEAGEGSASELVRPLEMDLFL